MRCTVPGPGRPVGGYRQRHAESTDDLMRCDWLSVPAKALRRFLGMELRRSGSTEGARDDGASWRHFLATPDCRHDIGMLVTVAPIVRLFTFTLFHIHR